MKEVTDAFGNWLAGFTAGEGSFQIGKRNYKNPHTNYECCFQIDLRNDDCAILEEIREKLGMGTICTYSPRLNDGRNALPQAKFRVFAINDCAELVKLFAKYPLKAGKRLIPS